MKIAGMKLALAAGLVSVGFVIWGAYTLITRTEFWWVSIVLGVLLVLGLWYGVKKQEETDSDS